MKPLPWIASLAFLCLSIQATAARGYIEEFYDAKAIEKSDPAAAHAAYLRSFHLAVAAENADYATSAGLNACFLLHNRGKAVEAGSLAREVLDAIHPLPTKMVRNDIIRRCELFGFLESGLLMEGRIGQAWKANRATAETLRGRQIPADAEGEPLTLQEARRLPSELRSFGWRILDQEAGFLDISGRSVEALRLLDEAAASINATWQNSTPNTRYYAYRLLASRSRLIDFLGDPQLAIQEQEALLEKCEGQAILRNSRLIMQLNLLRNRSQWNGPSTEILEQAREICQNFAKDGPNSGAFRLLAKMELDLHESEQAMQTLKDDAAYNAQLNHLFESTYADRDLLFNRAEQGEEDLDAEFARLLTRVRGQGNKRAEPSLYREYGNYLLDRKRPAQAIPMFAEALRLTRAFGWTFHEPGLLTPLFNARLEAGDLTGARATLAELDSFLAAHPELPIARRVAAEVGRAMALARLGEADAARTALALARSLATDLPEHKKRHLTPEAEDAILKEVAATGTPAPSIASELRVQPLEIVSIATPGTTARTRFTVFNPGNTRLHGHWILQGPGALATENSASFDTSKPPATIRIPQAIGAGDAADIPASFASGTELNESQVTVAWQTSGQNPGPSSTWSVRWDPAATGSIVLDASSLESGPFRFATLYHELAVPTGEDIGIPFRLRSPIPLRIEYYDPRSQQLLAVDANGNGDFGEAGDLHVRGPAGIAAAILPVTAGDSRLTMEIHIFPTDGQPIPPSDPILILEAQTYLDGTWQKQAEDTLR